MIYFLRFCLFFFLTNSFGLFAQVYYSTDPNYLNVKKEQNNILSSYQATYPDTSLVEFNNYFPRNFLGNMGLSSADYLLKYGTQDIGFRYFKPPTDIDRFDVSQVSYFRTKGPYASLTGIAGSKRTEIFKLVFTHTYRDKVNITAGFQRYTSTGFYKRQQTYTNNFFLTSNYTTTNKRSGYYLYILNNGNKSQENGGIQDVTLTDSSYKLTKELFPVNINNADRENKELRLMFNPWVKLNAKADSLARFNHYLQLKSSFVNRVFTYKEVVDSSEHFYENIYLDSLKTNDSSHVRSYVNDLSYSVLKNNETLGLSFGYTNELTRLWQLTDSIFMNHIAHGEGVFRKKMTVNDSSNVVTSELQSKLAASYIFDGMNKGNFKIESNSFITKRNKLNSIVFVDALYEERKPDYMQLNWTSNHFIWNNNSLKNSQQLQAKIGYRIKGFQVWALAQSINNYVYYNTEALPQQSKKAITNIAVNLNFNKVFLKHLGFAVNYVFQNTSDPGKVRLPANSASVKLFYNGILSNNNLQLQFGTQVSVYDSFTSYSYMPATQVFYLQENFKTETYPYLDVYLNVRIRPVSFFIKVENALYGFAGTNYSLVKGYYQTDRAFRFGITWMFFD